MSRFAIVNAKSGGVANIIDYDAALSSPPPGFADGFAAGAGPLTPLKPVANPA
jgi:hypothetical protein